MRKTDYVDEMRLELPRRKQKGRPNRRFMDVVEGMRVYGVTEEDRVRWRQMICCGDL